MQQASEAARKIVHAIILDLTDRRGLRQEWDRIEADLKAEIRANWESIVDDAVSPPRPKGPLRQATMLLRAGLRNHNGAAALMVVPGVASVTWVFPNHEDERLARLFVADLTSGTEQETICAIRASGLVETVEGSPVRTAKA